MRDPITDAAQDPSCLLCLTPDRGGSWWSRLRPVQLRNFADNPMEWREFSAVAAAVGTDGFSLEITFNRPSKTAGYLFYGAHFFGFMLAATNILCRISVDNYVFIEEAVVGDLSGRHTLKMTRRQGGVDYYLDGALVKTNATAWDVDLSLVFTAGRYLTTDLDGTVESIALMNDTTGEIVWQAAYSDLYDTSNPWPSPVPRNFSDNPVMFADSYIAQDGIGTDDFTLSVDFTLLEESVHGELRIGCMYCIYYNTGKGHQPCVWILKSDGTKSALYPVGTSHMTGDIASIKVIKTGQNVRMVVHARDGSTIKEGTVAIPDGATVTSSSGATTYPGNISAASIRNDTTGRTVWSYPSEAERVRLITKTNVRTDRGAFEAADVSVISRVATQLDLRGAYAEKTFIADCWFPATSNNGTLNYFPVITQGDGLSGSGSSLVVNFSVQADYRASAVSRRLQLTWADASGSVHTTNVVVTDAFFGKRHRIVGVIRPGASSAQYINELYIDGEFVGSGSGSVSSFVFGKAAAASIAPGNLHLIERDYTGFLSQSSLLYGALIFDRALSAAEIAALTPKGRPLSWAGIRDVVRRGRAQRYFAVGDVLTVATPRWTIEYEVVGFDQIEPADAALTHSMTLLPVRLVTNLQFDAPEPGNPDANRAQYGCNRWDWSSIRQWLNSAAAPGEWWTAQHEYDAAPAYAATLAGFMADLPADFLSAVAPARLTTALSNAYGGGSVETVDRFWPPSRTEIFGALDGGMSEGVQMTKYVDATDADRIKYNSAGTASGWGLRSPNRSNSYNIVNVAANGIMQELSWSSAWSGGIVPACIIA